MDKNKVYKNTSKTIFLLGFVYICLTILTTVSLVNMNYNIIKGVGINYIICAVFVATYILYKKGNKYSLTIHYILGIILLVNAVVHMIISGFNIFNFIYPALVILLAVFTHKAIAGIAQ